MFIYKDSTILEVQPKLKEVQRSPDMDPVLDFLKTWQNGLNRRFMVKEISGKFRFGVGFTFLDDPKYKNQSLLFVLIRYLFLNKILFFK